MTCDSPARPVQFEVGTQYTSATPEGVPHPSREEQVDGVGGSAIECRIVPLDRRSSEGRLASSVGWCGDEKHRRGRGGQRREQRGELGRSLSRDLGKREPARATISRRWSRHGAYSMDGTTAIGVNYPDVLSSSVIRDYVWVVMHLSALDLSQFDMNITTIVWMMLRLR